jgi:hypothetical protein
LTRTRAWWEHPAATAALILSVTLPLWFTSIPPLIDLLTHMARYRVQIDLAHDPLLQRNWAFHWALIGNLGVDLLVWPLARLIGLERAVWCIITAIPALLAWGMLRSARAVHGRIPGTALAALPFTLAYPFQFGFVNFWLGIAFAFHAFAFWPRTAGWRHWLIFVPVGLALWTCHAFAWGVLGALVGSWELAEGLMRRPFRPVRMIGTVIARCAPLLPGLIPMLLWRHGVDMATFGWFDWESKLIWFTEMLHDQSRQLDVLSLVAIQCVLIGIVLCALVRDRRLPIDPHLGIATITLMLLYILMPNQLFGSGYADMRMAPLVAMVAILAIAPPPGVADKIGALAAVALLAIRLPVSASGYAAYDRDFTSHLRALDHIAPGSKVVALVSSTCDQPWREPRLQHLASLAVVRRDAFVNTHWKVAGAELLQPIGALGTPFNADPSQFVRDSDECPSDLRPQLARRIAMIPHAVFDYVWVLGFAPASLPRYDGLRPIFADNASVLYVIEHEGDRR